MIVSLVLFFQKTCNLEHCWSMKLENWEEFVGRLNIFKYSSEIIIDITALQNTQETDVCWESKSTYTRWMLNESETEAWVFTLWVSEIFQSQKVGIYPLFECPVNENSRLSVTCKYFYKWKWQFYIISFDH